MNLKPKYVFTMTQEEYNIINEFLDLLCNEADFIDKKEFYLGSLEINKIREFVIESVNIIKEKG